MVALARGAGAVAARSVRVAARVVRVASRGVEAVGGDLELPVAGDRPQPTAHEVVADRAPAGEHLLQQFLGALRVVQPEGVGEAAADVLLGRDALEVGVGADQAELRVEYDEADAGLGEQRREDCLVPLVGHTGPPRLFRTFQPARPFQPARLSRPFRPFRLGRFSGTGRVLGVRHGSTRPPAPAHRCPDPGTRRSSIARPAGPGHRWTAEA